MRWPGSSRATVPNGTSPGSSPNPHSTVLIGGPAYVAIGTRFDRRSHSMLISENVKSDIGITRPRPLDEIARHNNSNIRSGETTISATAVGRTGSRIRVRESVSPGESEKKEEERRASPRSCESSIGRGPPPSRRS